MEIAGEQRFTAPVALVWDLLFEAAALRASIPGCERLEQTRPGVYAVGVRAGIAAFKGTFEGTATVADVMQFASYRLMVIVAGASGSIRGEAAFELLAAGDGALVRYRGSFSAQGGLARLGPHVLEGSAKLLAGQFFKAFEKQVAQRVV